MATTHRSEQEQVARKQASSSVLKALDLVECLAAHGRALSLHELSELIGRPTATTHRLLRTLELRGFVENTGGSYRLTLKLFQLGESVINSIDVVDQARPICEELARQLEETVNVAVRSGTSAVYVVKVDSPRSLQLISRLGLHVPLHCTALGKVLLAYAEPSEREQLINQINFEHRARNTITNRKGLEKDIAGTLQRGWAVDNEEFDFGLVCIAAPVFDHQGCVRAAISASSPKERLSRSQWPKFASSVRTAADAVSSRLGLGLAAPR